jgi:hypothetical protein
VSHGAFAWAASGGIGLLSGFTSRRALRDHTAALRGLASITAVIVSMLFVGWLSGGDAGLVIHRSAQHGTDWGGIIQVALASGSAVLALAAWNGGQARTAVEPAIHTLDPVDVAHTQAIRQPRPTPARPGAVSLERTPARLLPDLARGARQRLSMLAQRVRGWRELRPAEWLRARLPKWSLPASPAFGRKTTAASRVRLLGVEEHRCPYCLDVVERHDPRGVVTCKVCHTRHHADCWAVAGMCQVPHDHR